MGPVGWAGALVLECPGGDRRPAVPGDSATSMIDRGPILVDHLEPDELRPFGHVLQHKLGTGHCIGVAAGAGFKRAPIEADIECKRRDSTERGGRLGN